MRFSFLLTSGFDRFKEFLHYIPTRLSRVDFFDILDIVYLAAILFFVFSFLRQRRVSGYLIGIAVWAAAYGVSSVLDLLAVKTVLGAVFATGVIVLIVIFTPEIREMLGRMGTDSFRGLKNRIVGDKQGGQVIHDESIDAVCQAAVDLSRLKTGALIVFQRSDSLEDVIQSGIELDAKISPYLIRNIFFDKSPLHDLCRRVSFAAFQTERYRSVARNAAPRRNRYEREQRRRDSRRFRRDRNHFGCLPSEDHAKYDPLDPEDFSLQDDAESAGRTDRRRERGGGTGCLIWMNVSN